MDRSSNETIRDSVRAHYREYALQGSTCCCETRPAGASKPGDSLAGPILGCGNPLDRADLKPGMDVLDLGSGAGREVLEAASRVAPGGTSYGVDMTDEMLAIAQENRRRVGATNAVFLRGTIENLPLPDASIDVVISNCVINLSQDKPAVAAEMYRVLRPGGRLAISDTVVDRAVPDSAKKDVNLWCACMSGAPEPAEYKRLLEGAGFVDVDVDVTGWDDGEEAGRGFRVGSAFISGSRPAPGHKSRPQAIGPAVTPPERARPEDLPGILALVSESGLPADGIEANLRNFAVIRDREGAVVGTAGVEFYGKQVLLRSVCISPEHRDKGLGVRLVAAALRAVASRGGSEVYLLTTTAEKYFEKIGFHRVERSEVQGAVTSSVEFTTACPKTAVAMRMDLPKCCC